METRKPPEGGGIGGLTAVDDESKQMLGIGIDLLNRLFVLARNSLMFDVDNEALQRPVNAMLEKLHELRDLNEEHAGVAIIQDNLFLNSALLKPDPGTYSNSRFLERMYQRLKVQEIKLGTSLEEPQLRRFMRALRGVLTGTAPENELEGIEGIELVFAKEDDSATDDTVDIDRRIKALRIFASSVALMARVSHQAYQGKKWRPSLVRRIAYDIADVCETELNLLMGLTHLSVARGRLGAHLVRVAILAFACAKKLALARGALVHLIMIALCHHLARPTEESVDDDAEAAVKGISLGAAKEDPMHAAMTICSAQGLNEALIRRVVGVFESTGWQGDQQRYPMEASRDLLGQIVLLSDSYSNLVGSVKPDEALRLLLQQHQDREPELTKLFANAVGIYPVGTVVRLASGARAVVVEAPKQRAELARPVVQLMDGTGGGLVDLSTNDQGHGAIVESLPADAVEENVTHFFLL